MSLTQLKKPKLGEIILQLIDREMSHSEEKNAAYGTYKMRHTACINLKFVGGRPALAAAAHAYFSIFLFGSMPITLIPGSFV